MPLPTHAVCDVHDVIVLGAGLSGIYSLYTIKKRFPQWSVQGLEAGSDVGGTWNWNKYPGCRIDTESLSYCYSFDKELLEEWTWKEQFASQPETHRYIKRVAEKHDLYKDIKFNTRIESAHWDDVSRIWTFVDETGSEYKTRFFISCLGFLSAPTLPDIPGIQDFRGQSFHTSRWPDHFDLNRDFAGKRIGVIGTGATGIQTITAISKEPSIESLTVFQRTANWSAPLHNSEIPPDQMEKHKTQYDALFQQCAESPTGFLHVADPRKSTDISKEERLELWEKLYQQPGFSKWLGVFSDTYTNRDANKMYSDFIADKIRQRVNDPETADSLIPKNHGFGTRRVPLESGYFEAYNKEHVDLVDLRKTPVEQVTAAGIQTSDGREYSLDVLIFATGFDAITGAFSAIEWHAKDGRPLISTRPRQSEQAIWADHRPRTFLGLTVPKMPNMFMILGPHQPFGNGTRSIEHAVEVVADMLSFCHERKYTYFEPTEEAVEAWTEHVVECSNAASLVNEVDSWMTGINRNVKGKTVRSVVRYSGSAIEYRKRCRDCRDSGYEGFVFR